MGQVSQAPLAVGFEVSSATGRRLELSVKLCVCPCVSYFSLSFIYFVKTFYYRQLHIQNRDLSKTNPHQATPRFNTYQPSAVWLSPLLSLLCQVSQAAAPFLPGSTSCQTGAHGSSLHPVPLVTLSPPFVSSLRVAVTSSCSWPLGCSFAIYYCQCVRISHYYMPLFKIITLASVFLLTIKSAYFILFFTTYWQNHYLSFIHSSLEAGQGHLKYTTLSTAWSPACWSNIVHTWSMVPYI